MTTPDPASLEAALSAKARQLDRLNEHFETSLWDWELGANTEWYSTGMVTLLDYSLDCEQSDGFPNELMRLLCQSKPSTELAARRIRQGLSRSTEFDERLHIVDSEGQSLWIRIRGAVSNNPNEGPYSAGVIEDITDRVLLETERQRFSEELERSNAELEAFATVASHDLKAPLRHIGELAERLGKPPEGSTSPALTLLQHSQLEQMKERIGAMDELLTGLLDYARIGRPQDRIETIDPKNLVTDALSLLTPPGHIRIDFDMNALPFTADRTVAQKCLRNLLDNAIKHANPEKPHVKIVFADQLGGVSCAIHDNGHGIPEVQRNRVFELFHTLEQNHDTKGAGMGLAIVKKSMETLGGSVNISTSALGGACIELNWPKVD